MPSVSKKQHAFMAMSADKKARKQLAHPAPVKVAKEFLAADRGKSFKKKGKK